MGSRRRRTSLKTQKKSRSVEGRCPRCTTIVRFTVSGPVGNEIFECTGCTTKYHVNDL
jgi:transcription elongation factor Elf1